VNFSFDGMNDVRSGPADCNQQDHPKRRHCMNIRLLTLALMLIAPTLAVSQQKQHVITEHTEHAQGRGCVRPARQKGCFVLHDIRGRRYWDLSFTGDNRPDIYTHIWFEGIGYPHDAHCNQGRPVHVSTWKVLPGACSRPSEHNAPSPAKPQ
jgi:hypothetical protein